MALQNVTTYQAVLGAVLARLRADKGLTQGDIAQALDLSTSAYSRLEKGESAISVEQLRTVSAALSLRASQVLDLAEEAAAALPAASGVAVQAIDRNAWIAGAAGLVASGLFPVAGAALGAVVGNLLKNHLDEAERGAKGAKGGKKKA